MIKDEYLSDAPRISKYDAEFLNKDKLDKMSKYLDALSDPIRIQILYLLGQEV